MPGNDPEKALEQNGRLAQDASSPTTRVFEARHATRHATRRSQQKATTTSQQKRYQAFADKLRDTMTRANINASEVARRVWGTAKDKRGYDVARNRDRIGHYLSGSSYPEPENLARLADAVGVPVEELAMPPETAHQGSVARSSRVAQSVPFHTGAGKTLQLTLVVPERPNMMRLQVDRYVNLSHYSDIMTFVKLLSQEPDDEPAAEDAEAPQLGSVISS